MTDATQMPDIPRPPLPDYKMFRHIQKWSWRRMTKKNNYNAGTVADAAKHFNLTEQEIVDIVGGAGWYFYIIEAKWSPEKQKEKLIGEWSFEHDGE